MSLLDAEALGAAADAQMRLPPPPVRPQRQMRSAWRAVDAIPRAAMAGLSEIAATGVDVASFMSAAVGPRKGEPLESLSSELGDSIRSYWKDLLRPDPATATEAENIVYGLARPLAKLGVGALLGGVPGALAASAEEGFTQSDELRLQNVDLETRTKVGLTGAATMGASVVMPLVGSTLARTAALYAAGGASNIAQTALTREILARADYADIAAQYDPLDPTLLAASFGIPLPFAAVGAARNIRSARQARAGSPGSAPASDRPAVDTGAAATPSVPSEVVDAAMVHQLTLQRSEHERGGQISPQPDLAPDQRLIEARFGDQVLADPDAALRAYAALPETAGGKIVNTDLARKLSTDYNESRESRALLARAVHGPASWVARRQWESLLARPPETGQVLILGGGAGSGKSSAIENIQPNFLERYDAIYDTTLSNWTKAVQIVEEALNSGPAGRRVTISFTARDPMEAITKGVFRRAMGAEGRTVPLSAAVQAHIDAPGVFQMLAKRYATDQRVSFELIDNTGPKGSARKIDIGDFPEFNYNGLAERAALAAREAHSKGEIDELVLEGLLGRGEGGSAQPPGGPRRSDDGGQPEPESVEGRARGSGPQGGPSSPAGPTGNASEVVTERGLTALVRYRLAEAGDLTTSHTDDLTPNTAFPAELQPRDRARAASAEQIARIEGALRPELLGESVKASDGAPIIGADGVVESGNARMIALRRAYASGRADGYRVWLEQSASRFGLTADQVRGMQRPVLVRERVSNVDRAEFARQANESAIADLSPAEQAKTDAARIDDLTGLVTNDDGTVNVQRSANFVRGFMRRVVSPNERGRMLQSDGRLSQAGHQRLRNAIFAKAYGDGELLAMLTESADSNVRNVLAGLLRAAPDVARLNDLIAAGARQPVDVAADLVAAVRELSRLRDAGQSVEQFLSQGNLIDAPIAPELNNLLVGLRENARSPRRVAEMVRQLVAAVDSLGDPRQGSILDAAPPGRADMTADVVERMREVRDESLAETPPVPEGPGADELDRSIADRLAALQTQQPDMVVRIDEQGQPVTLADELNRIRREAQEGTDTELGAADADLLRAAANCALSTGA